MKTYNISRLPTMITLGYDGENNWRPQTFDCTSLLANHPDGIITLWLLPNGESQAFPVSLVREGDTVVWTPTSGELTAKIGSMQFVCVDGEDVGKSQVIRYRVDGSILPGADHPEEVPSWATQTVERAESAADRAEEAAMSIDIDAIEAQIAQAVEDYLEEHPIEAPVQSVNGKMGAVTLDASDVHALPDSTVIPVVPQMATQADMSDWTSGKTVDASAVKTVVSDKQNAPLEIPVTESGGTYSTTATAEQIRAAKENSIFVIDGEARIKALLWLPLDEGVDLLIGMQMLNSTIMLVAATVSTNIVSIAVEQTPIPALAVDPDMTDWLTGKTVDAAVLKSGVQYIEQVIDAKADAADIPTEQTVSGWGFTKNTGTYSKPSGGIPKTDLAQAVQTSLGKADSALQQHQSLSAYQTKAITDTGNYFTTDTVEGALQEIGAELSGVNTLIGSGVIS